MSDIKASSPFSEYPKTDQNPEFDSEWIEQMSTNAFVRSTETQDEDRISVHKLGIRLYRNRNDEDDYIISICGHGNVYKAFPDNTEVRQSFGAKRLQIDGESLRSLANLVKSYNAPVYNPRASL